MPARTISRSSSGSREFTSAEASPAFPFALPADLASLQGPTYTTGQTLVQQVAYAISQSLFVYSPPSFDLDAALNLWHSRSAPNGRGAVPNLTSLESRAGAASVLLGYVSSASQGSDKTPHSVLASTATLKLMEPVLAQYAVQSKATAPLAFHIAALDYAADEETPRLVVDYTTAIQVTRDLGLGLVAPTAVTETQYTALLTTLLSALVVPSVHIYDGISYLRQSALQAPVENVTHLAAVYDKILDSVKVTGVPVADGVRSLLLAFNDALNVDLKPFVYTGASDAETVLVTFGTEESTLAREFVSQTSGKVGVLSARIYCPFLEREFLATLPPTVTKIVVAGQVESEAAVADSSVHSALYADVRAAVAFSSLGRARVATVDAKYPREKVWNQSDFAQLLNVETITASTKQAKFTFYGLDEAESTSPATLASVLALEQDSQITYQTSYDNFTLGGIHQSEIVLSGDSAATASRDVVFVADARILSAYDVITPSTTDVIVVTREDDKITPQDVIAKGIRLTTVDFTAIGPNSETEGRTLDMVHQIAFWRVAFPQLAADKIVTRVWQSNGVNAELVAATIANLASRVFEVGLALTETAAEAKTETEPETKTETEEKQTVLKKNVASNVNSFAPFKVPNEVTVTASSDSSTAIAKRVVFKEAYDTTTSLRPDLSAKTFVVKVQENRRVTPSDYDRNIFHIEFDITGTGLKYELGEALGVHARNNAAGVADFLEFYGLNPFDIVNVPHANGEFTESRTVQQAFTENLDLFGKPPKRFYESLVEYIRDDEAQLKSLSDLVASNPEGAAALKHRAEVECSTYVDVLREFSSAHPPLEELVLLINPLKRREYSIASSQRVHPNAVHLLIVVVGWVDPQGRQRYGQSSKYLSDLAVGSELVVSVKPSVMKLPPLSTQPIIMAGLGTGLAPFKAFVEEKAWQKAQGLPIGEVYLYLGSRTQREEYLYGELWEAYKAAGVITHIGAAFSRDQPEKIYIQDRIRQTMPALTGAFVKEKGGFYLCGPTWPVPDVTQVLSEIIETEAEERGVKITNVAREIETLKEEGRYVLEVY
ncbi:hypothetical protein NADFUDRAFT_83141 [Nadsonia fulvescens var. elongata DSM 6958]|uniref:assimilatory sulfite reductase (NADPH) n=1 Tax=Nadsonia fulvescens var. elongata DSM 6958 TaxID=857566 RepID=A0A1E3PHZ7_9ASCO|nr:hypothetical protein NADFUDRAFT_83141 [Nadsonia fulvescens var. elongata DSM 6958]